MDTLRYVIFDGYCSVCTQMAETIQSLSAENLEILSIHDKEARALLDQAYPEGWKHAPYLMTIKYDGDIQARTGIAGAYKLMKILGVRNAWRIWRMASRQSDRRPLDSSILMSRRKFFKIGLITGLVTAVAGKKALTASACEICVDCSVICYLTVCGAALPCPSPHYSRPCVRADCYDQATGQYCDSFIYSCSPCGFSCV